MGGTGERLQKRLRGNVARVRTSPLLLLRMRKSHPGEPGERERERERAVDSGGRRAERYYLAEIMPTAHFLDVPDTTTLTGILPSAGGITTCECNRLGNLFHDANLLMACEQGRPSFEQSRIIIILKLSKNALLLLLLLSLFPSTCALAGLLLSRNGATLCIASH